MDATRHHPPDSLYIFIFLIALMSIHIAFHLENYDIIFGWIIATGLYGVLVSNGMRTTMRSLFLYFLGTQGFAVAIRATIEKESPVLGLIGVILSVIGLTCFILPVFRAHTIEDIAEIFACGVISAGVAIVIQLFGASIGPSVAVPGLAILLVISFVALLCM